MSSAASPSGAGRARRFDQVEASVINPEQSLSRKFMSPTGLPDHCSKFPASAGLHLRHGYRGRCVAIGPPRPVSDRDPAGPVGVRVTGEQQKREATMAERLSAEARQIGADGIARLVRDARPRGHRADLHLQGFQRSLRLHDPRGAGGRKEATITRNGGTSTGRWKWFWRPMTPAGSPCSISSWPGR